MASAVAAAFAVMVVVVVVARRARLARERASEKLFDGIVTSARDTGVQADASALEHVLRAAADAAADDGVHAVARQEIPERAMSLAVRRDDFACSHGVVFYRVHLERFAFPEML